jgi:hypothetical protein
MTQMKIRTFGQTAEITAPTRAQVVETMHLITDVHRKVRGELEYLCPYFHAKAITEQIEAGAVVTRISNRADRIRSAGRFRQARIALSV